MDGMGPRGGRRLGRFVLLLVLVSTACTGTGEPTVTERPGVTSGPASPSPTAQPTDREMPGTLRVVGHDPLFARGMNAALAVAGDHVYVGSRTDGSRGHEHPGILVVDVRRPNDPRVVHEIGRPHAGILGETSRELRVWPRQDLLIVMSFRCDQMIHDCALRPTEPMIRFFDIRGPLAARPRFVTSYRPSREPHEFFLWEDPRDRGRALMFMSTTAADDHLLIADISRARDGKVREIAAWGTTFPDPGPLDGLHSLSVSPDGRRAYLAYLTAGSFVLDTSEVAEGVRRPRIAPVTPLEARVQWPGPGAHSAVKIPGRDVVLVTDEVYGSTSQVQGGCPWGWVRLIDVTDETSPAVLSEYRVPPYNDPASCAEIDPVRDANASFSSHNPTVTEHLAFVTWHSAGLQVLSTEDPSRPAPAAELVPAPLEAVATEDPALSSGPDKVVMWSYPIVKDGLVYVVDVRNGLYVLSYRGPFQDEVGTVRYLEGSSNLG